MKWADKYFENKDPKDRMTRKDKRALWHYLKSLKRYNKNAKSNYKPPTCEA